MKYLIARTTPALAIIMFSLCAAGQPPKDHRERCEQIETLKISFITQKLDLTREEAQRFWPVYNEYQDVLRTLRKERKEEFKTYRERFDELTEEDLSEMVDKQIINRQRELDLRKKYHAEFKSILPIKKIALLYRAEDEFKAKVLREFKSRN